MTKKEFKGIQVISPNVKKLSILEELAVTARINAQSVMTNNETILKIVSELNKSVTHVNVSNSTFNMNKSDEPVISIKTDSFPDNVEEVYQEEPEEDFESDFEKFFDEVELDEDDTEDELIDEEDIEVEEKEEDSEDE